MTRFAKRMVLALLFSFAGFSASAEIYVGLELPLAYSFKSADDGSSLDADGMPSGYILLAQLPFIPVGAGLESYDIKLDQSGDHQISLFMADAFYVLPIPIVDIALGAGYGTVEVKGDNAGFYDKTNCSQYFLRIGVPFGPAFKVIASYHNVFARVKTKGSDDLLEAGGTLTTIGLAVGF